MALDTTYHEAYDVPENVSMNETRPFTPDVYKTPVGWKAVVKAARQTLLKSLSERTARTKVSAEQLRLLD